MKDLIKAIIKTATTHRMINQKVPSSFLSLDTLLCNLREKKHIIKYTEYQKYLSQLNLLTPDLISSATQFVPPPIPLFSTHPSPPINNHLYI